MSDHELDSRSEAVGRKRKHLPSPPGKSSHEKNGGGMAGRRNKWRRVEGTFLDHDASSRPLSRESGEITSSNVSEAETTSKESGEISSSANSSRRSSLSGKGNAYAEFTRSMRGSISLKNLRARPRPLDVDNGSDAFEKMEKARKNVAAVLGDERTPKVIDSHSSNSREAAFEREVAIYKLEQYLGLWGITPADIERTLSATTIDLSANEMEDVASNNKMVVEMLPSEEERMEQLRYFHACAGDLLRCLNCGAKGHSMQYCPMRTCEHCRKVDSHASVWCPTWRRCGRCHLRGHDSETCVNLSVVRNPTIACDICGENGHVEELCPRIAAIFPRSEPDDQFNSDHPSGGDNHNNNNNNGRWQLPFAFDMSGD